MLEYVSPRPIGPGSSVAAVFKCWWAQLGIEPVTMTLYKTILIALDSPIHSSPGIHLLLTAVVHGTQAHPLLSALPVSDPRVTDHLATNSLVPCASPYEDHSHGSGSASTCHHPG